MASSIEEGWDEDAWGGVDKKSSVADLYNALS